MCIYISTKSNLTLTAHDKLKNPVIIRLSRPECCCDFEKIRNGSNTAFTHTHVNSTCAKETIDEQA